MNIISFLRRRLLQLIPVLFGIVLVVFLVVRLIPGDPARIMLGVRATETNLANLRNELGLNLPLWEQFLTFFGKVLQGDLGNSLYYRTPVTEVILERIAPTVSLVALATLLSIAFCVPLAVWAARREGKWPDHLVRWLSTLALAMPGFWVGLNLLILLGVVYRVFPISGYGDDFADQLYHLALPSLTIAIGLAPILTRSLRASLIDAMQASHVQFARTKGLPHSKLFRRHVLRNGMMATVTILGVNIGWLMGGTVVVETVFSIPGIGALIVSSITARDYPMIQGIALFFGLLVIIINIVTDIVYALLDPRVTYD